jgi:2,7-dihydroxy-5-methyl-1-naphthoate 7-O-methyltransferase
MNDDGPNLEALTDLCTPWCIHVVVTVRVAEHIASGTHRIDELAAATGCDAFALHRILTYLVGKSVFEEPRPGEFQLNNSARQLLDPLLRIGLDLDGIGGRFAHSWGTLLHYARTGKPGYAKVFGLSFWEDLDANPKIGAEFDALIGPTGHGKPNPEFQITGGWDSIRSVTDVGGGTGAMLAEILRHRPQLHGTLVDLPRTVALSNENFEAAGVADRVVIVGQSFFEPLPSGADLYLLKGIINDWPDAEASVILNRCADAARPSGRVIILGGVVPDGTPRPLMTEMVLVGGKHRSVSEMRKLARESGLEVISAERQQTGHFVVECRPRA